MKLSGMRDGPKKSVTVLEIPGQLGPMFMASEVIIVIVSAYSAWNHFGQ